jgi:serine/threonine protein kinase/lipoprotein NlpI
MPNSPENLIGVNIKGEYHLNQLLGVGRYGAAYGAIRISNHEEVAVKVQYPTVSPERGYEFVEQAAQFLKEAILLEVILTHAYIIPLKDKDIDSGKRLYFYVMPVAEAGSLRRYVSEARPLPPGLAVRFVSQTAEGLQFAHDQRVIHQDIKPENLLLHRNTQAHRLDIWIADFGLAIGAHSQESLPKDLPTAGSAGYIAPEQWQGQPTVYSDQYALAIVTYELLSGKRPFPGKQFSELVYQHLKKAPLSFSEQGVQITLVLEALQEVLMKALAKNPLERYQNIKAFSDTLQETCVKASEKQDKHTSIFGIGEEGTVPLVQLEQQLYAEAIPCRDKVLTSPLVDNVYPVKGELQASRDQALPQEMVEETVKKEAYQEAALLLLDEGIKLSTSGKYEEALVVFDEATRRDPGNSAAFNNKGNAFNNLGRYEEALVAFDEAIRLAPKNARTYHSRGFAYYNLKLYDKAIADFDQALQLAPKHADVYNNRGNSYYALKQYGKAIADYNQALQLAPKHALAYENRGNAYYALKQYDRAITDYSQALTLDPKNADAYRNQGNAYKALQQYNKALADYERARQVAPSPPVPPLPSDEPQPPQRGISRRTFVVGLAGLAAAGTGIALFAASLSSHPATPTPRSLPPGTTLLTYKGHSDWVDAVAWSPDGKRIASGSRDETVHVWDAANGGHIYTYAGHSDIVWAVVWSPDGRRIASGSTDHTVQVWDATTGANVLTYKGHSDRVVAVAWSPDGKRIASGSGRDITLSVDQTVQVWDATTGANILTYKDHSDALLAVAWSPDGRRIASGGWDKTVQVWDATTGANVLTYKGHSDRVHAVAWSPDGSRIASASWDGTVQVWDAADGGHVFIYRGHSNFVWAVAWSPDGRRIASGSTDQTVQVWGSTPLTGGGA